MRFPAFPDQRRAAVNIPAQNKNAALRLEQRASDRGEIIPGTDQHRGTSRVFLAPNIFALAQKHQ